MALIGFFVMYQPKKIPNTFCHISKSIYIMDGKVSLNFKIIYTSDAIYLRENGGVVFFRPTLCLL